MYAQASEVPEKLKPLFENKRAIAQDLGETIQHCVTRKDTTHAAFQGCVDWHSSVHGVWALIAIMRGLDLPKYDQLVRSILSPQKLAAEHQHLKNDPSFEMPYGRAWFLRLAIEYERYYKSGELRKIADYVLDSMLKYYEQRRLDPQSGSYNSASWALVNMLDYSREFQNSESEKRIETLIIRNFNFDSVTCDFGTEQGHFMAVCTNIVMLAGRTMEREEFAKWVGPFFDKVRLPRPVKHPENWHHYGLNFSRAWGLWDAYSLTGDSKYADAYLDHFQAGYDKFSDRKGDYLGIGHWVAQFAMFALQPLFGKQGKD